MEGKELDLSSENSGGMRCGVRSYADKKVRNEPWVISQVVDAEDARFIIDDTTLQFEIDYTSYSTLR